MGVVQQAACRRNIHGRKSEIKCQQIERDISTLEPTESARKLIVFMAGITWLYELKGLVHSAPFSRETGMMLRTQ